MDKRAGMLLRVLINHYHPHLTQNLLQFLPEEERAVALAQEVRAKDFYPLLNQTLSFLQHSHHSWIKPLIQQLPDALRPLAYSLLTDEQRKKLHLPTLPVSSFAKLFILHHLQRLSNLSQHFPLEYLPKTEFSPLAKWDKQQLMQLIDFLGLYDLAAEVRHIVDRKILQNIYQCLDPKQLYYLKVCLHQKEQLVSPKLGINPLQINHDQLKHLLHRRGIVRFGLALSGQERDFIWYLAHILDVGRGELLLKNCHPLIIPKITPILKQQVYNLMNFLQENRL